MIKLENISKTFHEQDLDVDVLKDIDIEVQKGEMIAILGPSGSGKTTLLNIISTIMQPDSGSYEYEGDNVLDNSDKENCRFRNAHVGYVFQNFGLLEDENAYNNIILPLRYNKEIKRAEWKDRVEIYAKYLGIKAILNRKVNKLSGGEKQRVAIARALVANQDLILADEPTGSLDKDNTKVIINLFKKINEQGKTIIIATHDLNVAKACDLVYQLSEGVIVNKTNKTVNLSL